MDGGMQRTQERQRFARLVDRQVVYLTDREIAQAMRTPFIEALCSSNIVGVSIITVFTGINYGADRDNTSTADLWFQTGVFGGELTGQMWRCETWNEAMTAHRRAVKLVIKGFLRA